MESKIAGNAVLELSTVGMLDDSPYHRSRPEGGGWLERSVGVKSNELAASQHD